MRARLPAADAAAARLQRDPALMRRVAALCEGAPSARAVHEREQRSVRDAWPGDVLPPFAWFHARLARARGDAPPEEPSPVLVRLLAALDPRTARLCVVSALSCDDALGLPVAILSVDDAAMRAPLDVSAECLVCLAYGASGAAVPGGSLGTARIRSVDTRRMRVTLEDFRPAREPDAARESLARPARWRARVERAASEARARPVDELAPPPARETPAEAAAALSEALRRDHSFGNPGLGQAMAAAYAVDASCTLLPLDLSFGFRAELEAGVALMREGRCEDALRRFEKVRRRFPGNADVLVAQGAALANLRRVGEAEAALREALRLDENVAHAREYLSQLGAGGSPGGGGEAGSGGGGGAGEADL